jgi:pimeloyl-ACP methyl ester carboxylesterase
LLAGQSDRLVPPALTLGMKDKVRDTESVQLAGVGHITVTQAPDDVAWHIRCFLA